MRVGKNYRFPEYREKLKSSQIIPENDLIPECGEERIICKVMINRDYENPDKRFIAPQNGDEEIIKIKITFVGNNQ